MKKCIVLLITFLVGFDALAENVTGKVDTLEIWANGNVAFTLENPVSTCGGQFVLNESSPGTKNIYSALLALKLSGGQVRVYYVSECGIAENYNSSPYHIPLYVYPQ